MESVKVLSPASVANLVCGFDIMGLSLHEPYDIIEVRRSEKNGITIKHTDHYQLPENPSENVAGVALQAMLNKLPDVKGLHVTIKKGIKPGSGLGSSAASAAGVVVAANHYWVIFSPKKSLCCLLWRAKLWQAVQGMQTTWCRVYMEE
jgi:homoserine kinase